jgi:SAM-dependent methyltransferase
MTQDPAAPDVTQRFGPRARDYARARPRYPGALPELLARALGLAPQARIVDLGCGTGLSSEPFLEAGYAVLGVEPNAAMRAQAGALAAAWPRFTLLDGRAEATGLPAGAADLLVAAQAFHWFDVPAARAEALRILRRPACAALLWNDRRETGSPFAAGYEALVRRYSPDYLEIKHRHAREDRVRQFFGHGNWGTIRIEHGDTLDQETLAARLNSASYMPGPADPAHAPMMAELRALFEATAEGGAVRMEFDTRVLYGSIDPAAAA